MLTLDWSLKLLSILNLKSQNHIFFAFAKIGCIEINTNSILLWFCFFCFSIKNCGKQTSKE